MPESMAQLVQAAPAAREQNSWNLARTTELWGMSRMKSWNCSDTLPSALSLSLGPQTKTSRIKCKVLHFKR